MRSMIARCMSFGGAATVFTATLIALAAIPAAAHDRSWPGKKLSVAMPEAKSFAQRNASLASAQVDWVETALGEPVRSEDKTPAFFVATDAAGKSAGVVLFLDARGANGKIELGLVLDPAGRILRVVLYEHSEPASVSDRKFLDQLAGKTAASKLKIGVDLEAPDESKQSGQAIASAAKRGALLAMAALGVGSPTAVAP